MTNDQLRDLVTYVGAVQSDAQAMATKSRWSVGDSSIIDLSKIVDRLAYTVAALTTHILESEAPNAK